MNSSGSLNAKETLMNKVQHIYEKRLSHVSMSTTKLGTTSLASQAHHDSIRDKLNKKYGVVPSQYDKDTDH